jgi:predicted AAA+ superfamily ATPase
VAYFYDHGMRNLSLSCFGSLQSTQAQGFVFQNVVGNLLLHELSVSNNAVKFWRTTDKAEVDFIIDRGVDPIGIEVKLSTLKKPLMTRSLRSFIDKYHPSDAWVVNLSLDDQLILGKTRVRFVPFFYLDGLVQELLNSIDTDFQVSERKFVYKFVRK